MKNCLITIEGPDGSGKGTIIKNIEEFLKTKKKDFIITKEPGSSHSESCKMFRNLVLNPDYSILPKTELFLYMADRIQHMHEVVIPAMNSGKIIICDRFIDSTYAYQGWGRYRGDEKILKLIKELNKFSTENITPTLTIILMVEPESGINRVKENKRTEFNEKLDRIEKENLEFHKRVHEGYMNIILDPENSHRNIIYIDTTHSSKEETWTKVKKIIKDNI